MMERIQIYSKKEPSRLLHLIFRFNQGNIDKLVRNEVTPSSTFLQAMCFEIPKDMYFKAHKHNLQERQTAQTHEAFFIFRGAIELSIFDIDNALLEKTILREGDCSVIIDGAHSFKALEPTVLYEFKNGPYYGPEKDKTYIE